MLLAERGINFSDPKLHDGCWLSLEMFDDGSYDIRTPEESATHHWCADVRNATGDLSK